MKLSIYRSKVDLSTIEVIKDFLQKVYRDILEISMEKDELLILENAFNSSREQYDASILQQYLVSVKNRNLALWVIKEDIYWKGMNFIFGCAIPWSCAILSVSRLHSKELIGKEAIYEVGHILGLSHCRNNCVMQFSNSLEESMLKPLYLCGECREKLYRKK